MKVLNLRCAAGHGFEGWFASEDDFLDQQGRGLLSCPRCASPEVVRLPSAPRLNLNHGRASPEAPVPAPSRDAVEPVPPQVAALQAAWLHTVREVMARTEDVGERFPEEARRMHYGEKEARPIRGQASPEEREALSEEGIEVVSLPVPKGLDGPTH